ncbi:MAG: SDR family NAD(P)-dependent oxidoreductase [Synechococcus sp. SB0678_bin_12]|nr:SDR family NAD(P)-dependent oxidoreductase [Synechococcus sp. SB0678_bin_12]
MSRPWREIFTPFGTWCHATKHVLEGWSHCLRIETAPHNIQVVVVEPGFIKTEFNQGLDNSLGKYYGDTAYRTQLDALIKRVRNGGADVAVAMSRETWRNY